MRYNKAENGKGGKHMDILKKRMRDLREDSDMKQSALAEALNISQSAISGYECGREPPLEVIFQYAEFFGVSVEYMLGLTNEKKPATKQNEKAIDDMQAAAAARGETPFSRDDVAQLAAAFVSYYKAGAPAGSAPMDCMAAFLPAMRRLLEAAAAQDVAALLVACNDVANAGLNTTAVMSAFLGVDRSTNDA